MRTTARRRAWQFYLALAIITACTLALQIVQTRILSVTSWYHLAFFVISVGMFGLTAGAVWVHQRPDKFNAQQLGRHLSNASMAFAVATALSLAIEMALAPVTTRSLTILVSWGQLAVCLAVPFFFSGIVVSLALTRSPFPIGRVYAVDMVGAAVGCLGVLLLLNMVDGPSAVLWISVMAAVAGVLFSRAGLDESEPSSETLAERLLARHWTVLSALVLLAAFNSAVDWGLKPVVVKNKVQAIGRIVFEEWNSYSRITAYRSRIEKPFLWGPSPKLDTTRKIEQQLLLIDGEAGTFMYRFGGQREDAEFLKYDVTNLAYNLPNRRAAAVIGIGGGRDVLSAWYFGAESVTGVEINPIFVRLLTDGDLGFRDYANIAPLDNVDFVIDEARSWFARTPRSFDIIQMSLIDTWAATGAGAFTLSENGLYTVEAWKIFLNRLSPDGVFTVSRWYDPSDINEAGRMISLAVGTLIDLGVKEPRNHIFVAAQGKIATLVLSKSPLSRNHIEVLTQTAADYEHKVLISPDATPASPLLQRIVSQTSLDDLVEATRGLYLDLTPPTDERPFFFNQLPFDQPMRILDIVTGGKKAGSGVIRGNLWAALTLSTITLVSIVLVVTTIVVPLRAAVRNSGRTLVHFGTIYFMLIGLGFMLVEIGLLQRMSVFLGHPVYSLSVLLFSLILATGLGSLVSDRYPLNSQARLLGWSVLTGLFIAGLPFWLPGALSQLESAELLIRAGFCFAVMVPAGFLMGFGFPTGMRLVTALDPRPTPWFWGINGAAGVLAASIGVFTSIALGIDVTLKIAAVCYLLLYPTALMLHRKGATAAAPV